MSTPRTEIFTSEDGKLRAEMLSAATFSGAIKVMKEFLQDEALCIGCEVSNDPLALEEYLELCADVALDGVSLVVIATDTEEVIAALFSKLQVAPPDSSDSHTFVDTTLGGRFKQESTKASVQLVLDVKKRCNIFKIYDVDCSLEILFMGVSRDHRNRNLGNVLGKCIIDVANRLKHGPISKMTVKDLGPKYSYMKPREPTKLCPKICSSIVTAKASQKIAKKLNFTEHMVIPFDEYTYKGKTYAERLGPEYPKSFKVVACKL